MIHQHKEKMTGERIQKVLVALKTCKNPFPQLGTISREIGQPLITFIPISRRRLALWSILLE
jgi:hypothetical protein